MEVSNRCCISRNASPKYTGRHLHNHYFGSLAASIFTRRPHRRLAVGVGACPLRHVTAEMLPDRGEREAITAAANATTDNSVLLTGDNPVTARLVAD